MQSSFRLPLKQIFIEIFQMSFLKTSIDYLGHIISQNGVELDPSKIEVMVKWPVPTSLKQLRGFLGFIGLYRRFIKNYAFLSYVLTNF